MLVRPTNYPIEKRFGTGTWKRDTFLGGEKGGNIQVPVNNVVPFSRMDSEVFFRTLPAVSIPSQLQPPPPPPSPLSVMEVRRTCLLTLACQSCMSSFMSHALSGVSGPLYRPCRQESSHDTSIITSPNPLHFQGEKTYLRMRSLLSQNIFPE